MSLEEESKQELVINKTSILNLFLEEIFIYRFYMSGREFHDFGVKLEHCYICKNYLKIGYVYIIKQLKKAKLLDEDYELRCCACNRQGDV